MSFQVQQFQPLPVQHPTPPPPPPLPPLPPAQQPQPQPTTVQSKVVTTHPLHTEIAYEKRIAIIALRLLFGFSFSTIAEKLDLRPRSAHQIFNRAQQRTREDLRNSFQDVAKNVKDAPRSGRPAIHPPGHKRIRSKKKKAPAINAAAAGPAGAGAGAGAGVTVGTDADTGAGGGGGGSATMDREGERFTENGAAIFLHRQDGGGVVNNGRVDINGPAEFNKASVAMKRPTNLMGRSSDINGPADITGASLTNAAAGLQGMFYHPSGIGGAGVTQQVLPRSNK